MKVVIFVSVVGTAALYMLSAMRYHERQVLVSACHIPEHWIMPSWVRYLTKPTTTVLLGFAVWWRGGTTASIVATHTSITGATGALALQRRYLRIALVFSLVGDVLLMCDSDSMNMFVLGLASFLVAHGFFIASFNYRISPFATKGALLPYVPFAALGVGALSLLLPSVAQHGLEGPVVVYTALLVSLSGHATTYWWATPPCRESRSAIAGAILFDSSDFLLGYNMFVQPIPYSCVFIHVTYWSAIGLLGHTLPYELVHASSPVSPIAGNSMRFPLPPLTGEGWGQKLWWGADERNHEDTEKNQQARDKKEGTGEPAAVPVS